MFGKILVFLFSFYLNSSKNFQGHKTLLAILIIRSRKDCGLTIIAGG